MHARLLWYLSLMEYFNWYIDADMGFYVGVYAAIAAGVALFNLLR